MKTFKICLTSEGKKVSPDSEECNIFMRTDITIEDLMKDNRWDSRYWDPQYSFILDQIALPTKPLNKFIESITYGVIIVGDDRKYSKKGVKYISSTIVRDTGIDFYLNSLYISKKDKRYHREKIPQQEDIIFNRSGIGTLGRQMVFQSEWGEFVVGDDVNLIRIKNISSYYISILLKSKYGYSQIQRNLHGVSGQTKISFDEIGSILIPIVPESIQTKIERAYKTMHHFHQLAMKAKKSRNDSLYQKNIAKAELLLKDLIQKTEEVIRGERKSI